MEISECEFKAFTKFMKTVISRLLSVSQKFHLLIFVIKNLHGIRALSLTVDSVIFGQKGVIVFLEL
jgi:hypothetical protein